MPTETLDASRALLIFEAMVGQATSGYGHDIWIHAHGQRPWVWRPAQVAKWRNLRGKRVRITIEEIE